MAVSIDGNTVYLGGNFNRVGPRTGRHAFIDAGTGVAANTMPKVDGTVYTNVPDGSGGAYIGGTFARVGKSHATISRISWQMALFPRPSSPTQTVPYTPWS